MKFGKNTCQWLTLSSTKFYARGCIGEYCYVHLAWLKYDRVQSLAMFAVMG